MYVPSQSVFMIYLRFAGYVSQFSPAHRSRFLAGVAIADVTIYPAVPYMEPDYLPCMEPD